MTRTAYTRRGKEVELHKTTKVDGGWISYVLNRKGFAVQVFVPC